jgi:hypothetical protein
VILVEVSEEDRSAVPTLDLFRDDQAVVFGVVVRFRDNSSAEVLFATLLAVEPESKAEFDDFHFIQVDSKRTQVSGAQFQIVAGMGTGY